MAEVNEVFVNQLTLQAYCPHRSENDWIQVNVDSNVDVRKNGQRAYAVLDTRAMASEHSIKGATCLGVFANKMAAQQFIRMQKHASALSSWLVVVSAPKE